MKSRRKQRKRGKERAKTQRQKKTQRNRHHARDRERETSKETRVTQQWCSRLAPSLPCLTKTVEPQVWGSEALGKPCRWPDREAGPGTSRGHGVIGAIRDL